jgi:phage terminase large subunit-like protein
LLIATAAARYRQLALQECFDPVDLTSRPTSKQLECLRDISTVAHRYATAGNQAGKSQLGAREAAWLFTDTHPFWKRPAHWGDEPLLLLVVGRTTKQVEEVLWRKISAFLDPDEIAVQRVGGVIQKVTHKKNRNTILFGSHHNEGEAREKLQAFVAHWAWVDELPGNVRLLEELHRRVQAKRGPFLATFTPKVPNPEIRDLVDNSRAPLAKKYQFSMLDNPIYSEDDKQRIIQSLETYPESYRRTILYGDWYQGESSVYHFDRATMIKAPENYHPSWRHVEASDPALQSKFGFTLWAEDPVKGGWYLIKADYIEGILTPDAILEEVLKRTAGVNIVRRISDPHEAWYINTASAKGISYVTPYNKNNRKGELIKGLQQALGKDCFVTPWCTDFQREIETCQWSETSVDRIVNASSYHLLDSAQYFVDCKPKSELPPEIKPWHQELREANTRRKKTEATIRKARNSRRSKWIVGPSTYRKLS